jgi:hypothetical protein
LPWNLITVQLHRPFLLFNYIVQIHCHHRPISSSASFTIVYTISTNIVHSDSPASSSNGSACTALAAAIDSPSSIPEISHCAAAVRKDGMAIC